MIQVPLHLQQKTIRCLHLLKDPSVAYAWPKFSQSIEAQGRAHTESDGGAVRNGFPSVIYNISVLGGVKDRQRTKYG